MFKKSDADKELERLISKQKNTLRSNFKKSFSTQQKTLELFLKAINHSDYNNFNDTKLIWNIAGFINIVSFDLKIVGQDLTFAKGEWQKRYYSRQASLIIYESLNDFFDLMGKDFRTLIRDKIKDDTINAELNQTRKELNEFKTEHLDRLKVIRNTSIAHKDNNIFKQIEIIQSINWSDTIELVSKFDKILNDLGSLFKKLIDLGLVSFEELKEENNNTHNT